MTAHQQHMTAQQQHMTVQQHNMTAQPMAGVVLGFLEHDMWKTGVHLSHNSIQAVAGLNGKLLTRDSMMPHGTLPI